MAVELNTDATALLEKLISKAYKAHERKKDNKPEKRPEQTLQGGRDSLEDIREVLSDGTPELNAPIAQDFFSTKQSTDADSPSGHPRATMRADISEPDAARDLTKMTLPRKKPYTFPDTRQAKPPSTDQVEAPSAAFENER